MSNSEAFGLVVREARDKLGLSQEELASRADLHVNAISLLERGRRSPSLDTILAIAEGLGLKPSRLMALLEKQLAK